MCEGECVRASEGQCGRLSPPPPAATLVVPHSKALKTRYG